MTQFSMPWGTRAGIGDGITSYNQDQAQYFFGLFLGVAPASMGVGAGVLNELAVSGTASPLTVDTGIAQVNYLRYINHTSSINVSVTTPSIGDTGGYVVLEANWTARTVRAQVITNTDGTSILPSLTQTQGTTWQIPLASFVIDTSGNIWTNTSKTTAGTLDARSFAVSPFSSSVRLRNEVLSSASATVTLDGIQQDLSHLRLVINAKINSTSRRDLFLRFNGSAAGNYHYTYQEAEYNNDDHSGSDNQTAIKLGEISGNDATRFADTFDVNIFNYTHATWIKNVMARGMAIYDEADWNRKGYNSWGWWAINPVQAITSLTLSLEGAYEFQSGSIFQLYGIM